MLHLKNVLNFTFIWHLILTELFNYQNLQQNISDLTLFDSIIKIKLSQFYIIQYSTINTLRYFKRLKEE